MTEIKLTVPNTGEKNTVAEPKVDTALAAVATFLNGNNLDGTTNIKAEGILEANLEKSLQEAIAAKTAGLTTKARAVSYNAVSGEMGVLSATGLTATLPAVAGTNTVVGVFMGVAGSATVKVSTGLIYGQFISGASSIKLLQNQGVTLFSTGTSWLIIGGEPLREGTYVAPEKKKSATEYELSKVRPALVTIICTTNPIAKVVVAGGEMLGGEATAAAPLTFLLPPGTSLKVTTGAAAEYWLSYILL
jgi:hypothetical protein